MSGDDQREDTSEAPLRAADVLGGLTGRRVSSALYAVESRAGMLALTDRQCRGAGDLRGDGRHRRARLPRGPQVG